MIEATDIDLSKVLISADKEKTLSIISETLNTVPEVSSAKVYGSSLLNWESNPDVDVAIMVDDTRGIVLPDTYARLKAVREELGGVTGCDIDLIPHTQDELTNQGSPLWNPRYYPSLHYGVNVKQEFPLPERINLYQDASAYVLHDNRTITRRQILRDNGSGNWRIFISKLIHGPANTLNYMYLHGNYSDIVNASDVPTSFKLMDEALGTDSTQILERFYEGKEKIRQKTFGFDDGVVLLNWYEALLSKTFNETI